MLYCVLLLWWKRGMSMENNWNTLGKWQLLQFFLFFLNVLHLTWILFFFKEKQNQQRKWQWMVFILYFVSFWVDSFTVCGLTWQREKILFLIKKKNTNRTVNLKYIFKWMAKDQLGHMDFRDYNICKRWQIIHKKNYLFVINLLFVD